MTVVDYRLCIPPNPTTEVVIVAKSDVNGPVDLVINGLPFQLIANTAVNLGQVKFHITGLLPDTPYVFTIDGVPGDFPVRTWPTAAGEFRALVFCCNDPNYDLMAMHAAIARHQPHAIWWIGDFVYVGDVLTRNGITTQGADLTLANSINLQIYLDVWEQMMRWPAVRKAHRYCPVQKSEDDHGRATDNSSRFDLALFQTHFPGATQLDLDNMYAVSGEAFRLYNFGQLQQVTDPSNPSFGYVSTGNCRIIWTDCMPDRSPVGATDNVNKLMYGPLQEAALIDAINNAPEPTVMWLSPKEFTWASINTDTFRFYATQLKRIFWAIRTRTGVSSIGGDAHLSNIQLFLANALGAGYPALLQNVAAPGGRKLNALQGPPANTLPNVYWKIGSSDALYDVERSRAYGLIVVKPPQGGHPAQMINGLYDAYQTANNGRVFDFTIEPDSNVPLELRPLSSAGGGNASGTSNLTTKIALGSSGGGNAGGLSVLDNVAQIAIDPQYQVISAIDGPRHRLCRAKTPDERVPLCFNMIGELLYGEEIESADISVALLQGTDPGAEFTKDGERRILHGRAVQWMRLGVDGVTYEYSCRFETTLGRIRILRLVVPVRESA